jgi:hypothetical protein
VSTIAEWLASLGLSEYTDRFVEKLDCRGGILSDSQ